MSGYWKIPLQALVLLVGVFLFVFYLFTPAPMLFNRVYEPVVREGARAAEFAALEARYAAASEARSEAAAALARAGRTDAPDVATAGATFRSRDADVRTIRDEAVTFVRDATQDSRYNDVNYVFPTFILTQMPLGLTGLLIAAIFAAAMSSISSELAALSSATVIDFYRRFVRPEASDAHFLRVSRIATAFWGLFASLVAVWAAELGALIEVVNRFGSFFYGSILGVFILAVAFRRASGDGAFVGLIAGMSAVAWTALYTPVAFLWHNVVGAVVVVCVGLATSMLRANTSSADRS